MNKIRRIALAVALTGAFIAIAAPATPALAGDAGFHGPSLGNETHRNGPNAPLAKPSRCKRHKAACSSDITAPTLLSVSVSPSTASPGDTITVSAHVTDAGTGVTNVGLQASLNGTTTPWCNKYASLTSGTAQDGTWSMDCAVPNTANSGTYSVYPYASDAAGNWVNTNGGPTTSLRGSFTVK